MIATKLFNRQGLVISVLGHVGLLVVFLLLMQATSQQQAVLPDAMQVEIVTPKEIPRYSGTPSMVHASGTEQPGQPQPVTEKTEQQPPTPPVPPQPKDQHQSQRNPPPKPDKPQTEPSQAQQQPDQPPLPLADEAPTVTAQQQQPQKSPPPLFPDETLETPDTAAAAARFALMGGPLGGGFAAPEIDAALTGYDFTLTFRELVSSCGEQPDSIGPNDRVSIKVRVFLNRDGTLTSAPQLRVSNPSAKQQALMQAFAGGLQKCQPYTMLPQDRYEQWKTLDLAVYPRNYLAQ
jgi:type IV secretory pathway VirB10-like protein